jgi:heat shock protein HslJ
MNRILMLLVVLAAACSPRVSPDASLVGNKWTLVEMNGVPVQVSGSDKDAHLVFNTVEKRYAGSSGCNRMMGTYNMKSNGDVKFSPPAGTMMACVDQAFENMFMKFFATVDRYEIRNDELVLKKDKTIVMRLKKM